MTIKVIKKETTRKLSDWEYRETNLPVGVILSLITPPTAAAAASESSRSSRQSAARIDGERRKRKWDKERERERERERVKERGRETVREREKERESQKGMIIIDHQFWLRICKYLQ